MTVSEDTAKYLLDHVSTAVLLFDETLCLSTMNISSEHLLSISCKQAEGIKLEELLPNNLALEEIICKSLTQGSPITEYEITLNLPSLSTILVDCTVAPVPIPGDGDGLLMELTNSDALNRISRKQRLIQQQMTAKESSRAMAHEIKNPLGGIRGAAQLLEQELDDSAVREYTQIIISEADRLRNLVDRMMTPHKQLNLQETNIHEVLEYVCSLVEAEATVGFTLERDYDPSLPAFAADREQLIQALLNVVRNAAQAIPPDGLIVVKTRIEYQVNIIDQPWNLAIKITVQDNGPGIPPEIEDSIFFPMITGRAQGSGLGLSIAQTLIQKHGGLIEYQRNNKLTEFTVLLPLENYHDR
ncbi:MAG: ATP-binding protein [Thiotrichales bacterium]|nr:ATP-binding protein [Thiotrichales bacterium]